MRAGQLNASEADQFGSGAETESEVAPGAKTEHHPGSILQRGRLTARRSLDRTRLGRGIPTEQDELARIHQSRT